jgi:large subunit ribosomal protein L21
MYAVIETGGKQYRVEVGTELQVELLDVEPGASITLERVLLVADGAQATVGTPIVSEAAVEAEVLGHGRGDKVVAFKYRPKARRRVKKGHRQDLTLLRIADIRFNGKSAAASAPKAESAKGAERKRLEEAAARQAAEDAALAAKLNVGATAEPAEPAEPDDAAKPARRSRTKSSTSAPAEGAETASTEGAAATPEAKTPAPRRPRAKATPTDTETGTPKSRSTAAAPKRSRTKKDE